jgi:hypothetical protein
MAHFAKIENGIVTNVLVVDNQHEAYGEAYLHSLGFDGTWVQTSFNANFGKRFAGIGDTYNAEDKVFTPARPFIGWVFDETLWMWQPPTPAPSESCHWDEDIKDWVLD